MEKRKNTTETEKKRELSSRLWLEYYNRTLFERGIITEEERSKMALKISGWQGARTSAAP